MTNFTPREIVSELDKYIVGQDDAKRAVAIALRNRWRRHKLDPEIRDEVIPKNILMIGPTGVGKTEISRRLAGLADAPFLKVEATKFTEIGFVGRDVEQIIRDLVEVAINMISDKKRKQVEATAYINAENRVLEALRKNPNIPNLETKEMRRNLRSGEYDDIEVDIEIEDKPANPFPQIEIPGMPGAQMGMLNLGEILGKGFGSKNIVPKKMTVKVSYEILLTEESEKLLDKDTIIKEALLAVENSGIVFLDEIDKICGKSSKSGAEISREGVQRDLLPLIEGTTVSTKHGNVKTDHILFIASGAFHLAKPSDLLPELQGRLPIRVELNALSQADFVKILCETRFNLIMQYQALIATEGAELSFSEDGIERLAKIAVEINESIENIGARRLHTVIEKVLDEILFEASDMSGEKIIIDAQYIEEHIGDLAKNIDLSRYIL